MRSPHQRARALTDRLVVAAALLAGLALLYGILGEWDESDVERGPAAPQRGYFATDVTMTEMGPTGRPRYTVHAREIEQQLSDQSVLMSDMALDYHTTNLGTWHVTALNGRMPEDRKSILLTGNVTVTGAEDRGGAVIHTDHVNYDIDGGIVQTADPVAIQFGVHELKARGLHAMLNTGTVKLESDVNGRYLP